MVWHNMPRYRLVWEQEGVLFYTGMCGSDMAEKLYEIAKDHPYVNWANVEYIERTRTPVDAPSEQ